MNLIDVTILAIVEGITEFLPISSTGHMILASHILQVPQSKILATFEIAIQIGPILAVAFLYYKKLFSQKALFYKACIGFIPTGILGAILYPKIKGLLGSEYVTVAALLIGGIAILIIEWYLQYSNNDKRNSTKDISGLSYKDAMSIGLIQSISMVPGVSRSAASIFGGMLLNLDRKSAVEFSFILAIPTMVAATALDVFKSRSSFTFQTDIYLLMVGILLSFVIGLVVVKWLLRYVQSNNFFWFGVYRIIFALIYAFLFLR